MRQRDRESVTDADPYGSLFDPADFDSPFDTAFRNPEDSFFGPYEADGGDDRPPPRVTRAARPEPPRTSSGRHSHRAQQVNRSRNRRLLAIMAALFALVLGAAAWLVVLPVYHYLHPSDYSGAGSGTVVVTVHPNDGATQIGTTLHDRGVVASVRAFTNAAKADAKSASIQPGSYRLRRHMSAKRALALLLDPAARVRADVLVNEGATIFDIAKRLTTPPCKAGAAASATCGPGLDAAAVARALTNVKALGLPSDYTVGGAAPASVEGFLFPATYYFPNRTSAADALQAMVGKFAEQVHGSDFTSRAKALGITPYQELIIASIAQGEARFAGDFPKVVRVILNRLAVQRPLQIDATTIYGARLKGADPSKISNARFDTPYNTYQHDGLPPTPIGNPGMDALTGAAHPATGNWLFYVNDDAAGHLVFMHNAADFEKARHTCHVRGWGCAGP